MNTNRLRVWQWVFILFNILTFALLPLAIALNAAFVLVGKLFVWYIQSGLHLVAVIFAIALLVYAHRQKSILPPSPVKVYRFVIYFFLLLNLIVLSVGGFFTYIIEYMMR